MRGWEKRTKLEYAACPHIPAGSEAVLATRGLEQAVRLIADVAELDPRQVWGRLVLMGREQPDVLVMMCVALAAMLQDVSSLADVRERLAWTEPARLRAA